MKAKQIQAEAIANTEQVIAPAAESPYAPRRWQFDSRRIYIRPRTRPQSARGVAAGSQVHIAQSSCAMGQTDRQIALSLNAPELSMGPFCMTLSNPTHQLTDPTQPNPLQVEKFGPNPTQPNTTNKFDCLMQPNLI